MAAPPFDREHPPRSILVVRLGAVGDVVRTLPAVRLLRRTWPAARIAWAVESGPAPLVAGHPDVDEALVLERRRLIREARGLRPAALTTARAYARTVRAVGAELALDFQSSAKSGLVAWLSRARVRVGFDRGFDREASHLFATHRVRLDQARVHRVERAVALARAAGADDGPRETDLALTAAERAAGRAAVRALAESRRAPSPADAARGAAIALAPFSSARQPWKRYPLERWADVARGLSTAGHAILVLAGPGEQDDARRLCAAAGPGAHVADPGGLRALAAFVAACDLFVGGDTGPMHIAWATGVPVVAVYGPTDPVLNAPFGAGHCILAPERPTRRDDADRFPHLSPARIVSCALEHLPGRRSLSETSP